MATRRKGETKKQTNEMIIGNSPGEATTMQGFSSGKLTSREHLLRCQNQEGVLNKK